MIHPHTRLAHVSDHIGFGVVATQFIPAGTIIWVRDPLDQKLPKRRANALGPLFRDSLRHFTFWESDDELILCWDHARFVNHSCEANCLGGGYEFEIAVSDIRPGEQLTDDYATFGYASELPCACGAETCRGRISRADAGRLAPVWDARLTAALSRAGSVEQPLWALLQEPTALEGELRRHRI